MNVRVHTWSTQHHRCHYQLICSLFSQPIDGLNACFPVRTSCSTKLQSLKHFGGIYDPYVQFLTCSLSLRSSSSLLRSQPLLYSYIIKWTTCVEMYFAGVPGGPPHWNTHKCLKCKCTNVLKFRRERSHGKHLNATYAHTLQTGQLASWPVSQHPAFPFWAVRSRDRWPPWRDIKAASIMN